MQPEIDQPPARITLFGHTATPAAVEVLRRPRAWRIRRALLSLAIAWGLAPVLFLVPPHLPWALAAVIAGIVLAWRRLTERVTLRSLHGRCPRCDHELTVHEPTRFVGAHPLDCTGCQNRAYLEIGSEPAHAD